MQQEWINSLVGGAIIGIAASLMSFLNGRRIGIVEIIEKALTPLKYHVTGDLSWRLFFIVGLLIGGLFMNIYNAELFISVYELDWPLTLVAGALVGVGILLAGTGLSSDGAKGMSGISKRSTVASVIFISAGMLIVRLLK